MWLSTREAGKPNQEVPSEGGKTVTSLLNFVGEKKKEMFCELQFHLHHCCSLNLLIPRLVLRALGAAGLFDPASRWEPYFTH